MGVLDNIRKTISYAQRNGIGAAIDAAQERMHLNRVPYHYAAPPEETLRAQRAAFSRRVMEQKGERLLRFSVVVPLYLTPKPFLEEMIDSVKAQTYGEWELICADASPREKTLRYAVEQAARDARVLYVPLSKNGGISENTNAAIAKASGEYIVLLDHDDLLSPDALYELEKAIVEASEVPLLVYSDEDKFETDEKKGIRRFFEPHVKPDFDYERLLSNNYICHLAAIRADVAKRLKMRAAYDGAQDHDLFLRVANEALRASGFTIGSVRDPAQTAVKTAHTGVSRIVHVGRVLYHWRVHGESTAQNPGNKDYAFDAGKRAIADALLVRLQGTGAVAKVTDLPHKGFYRVEYEPDLFAALPDVGLIGGKIIDKNGTLTGGKMTAEGEVYYEGLPRGRTGGFEHPAVLRQEAEAVDLRCVYVRGELEALYRQFLPLPAAAVAVRYAPAETEEGEAYKPEDGNGEVHEPEEDRSAADTPRLTGEEIRERSLAFSKAVRERGYRILWDPQFEACGL